MGAIDKPVSIMFARSWKTAKVPENCRKANVTSGFKSAERSTLETTGQSASIPGKGMEHLLWMSLTMCRKRGLTAAVNKYSARGNIV